MIFSADAQEVFSFKGKRVWVAGHAGLVGSALVRRLAQEECETLTVPRRELDLTRQADTERWIEQARPDVILVAAAKVGGIGANATYPADFLYDNLVIAANIAKAAQAVGVEKMLWIGSSCIYPKFAPQPIPESALLTGSLEPTNEAYAIAKIATMRLADCFRRQYGMASISVMPTSLYGENDNFHLENSHVIPAILRKMHEAKIAGQGDVVLWGTGTPLREFLHVDDLAEACIFLMKRQRELEIINIGSGEEISIRDLAGLIADIVGFRGQIIFDVSKPDGTPRKLLDTTQLRQMGWSARIPLRRGIEDAYRHWQEAHVPQFETQAATRLQELSA